MIQNIWMKWILLVGLPLIFAPKPTCLKPTSAKAKDGIHTLSDCLTKTTSIIVADSFNGFITAQKPCNQIQCLGRRGDKRDQQTSDNACIVFLQINTTNKLLWPWPQMESKHGSYLLYIPKWYIQKKFIFNVVYGNQCNTSATDSGTCKVRCLTATTCDKSIYDESYCQKTAQDKYIISITETEESCTNCDNPVKTPEKIPVNVSINVEGGKIDPVGAVNMMNKMAALASSINELSAELSVGEGITGVLVKQPDPVVVEEVSFAYMTANDSLSIIADRDKLDTFSRSVTVTKEAFEKAVSSNISVPFAAVFRFINMAKDELNSTVLGNEILAIELGTTITNLTDKININFQNMKYKGIPSCHSWNGEGSHPNWTNDGCHTILKGNSITCRCSHLTFFAVLLSPLNETIPSNDLNTLTTITQIGCGISIFFLSIVLFMHFLLRKTKASGTTRILIHLVIAMFMLDFTFLINNVVAKLKSSLYCTIMAAFMHYFMLATFTWFSVQAFHLCLNLYTGGKILIRHYLLKIAIISWVIPIVVGTVLLITGKYGEQVIHASNSADDVAMCWITDSVTHYIVNIGYYVLVFIFTFTTFIIILSWLFCLNRTKPGTVKVSKNGRSIVSILGLCCMLGITWGFAFFAHGILLIPSSYIFTVLNSLQGFFLFIYYYNTGLSGATNTANGNKNLKSQSTSTLKTSADIFENPYVMPDIK
ncbi:adhesion G-protein coupled receptor G2-like isoform X2 [Mastacembelus armatus]|uniref:adhesion G-protein coupled receptor G2-like isoform X2 n=1 Tax=Mastacembelus armatus TaxID=205130 RepID=UPI000E45C9EA|nr:adhesion G-protein coupled receptor G2-like isoform X2 [Mastacembelus armatus]